MRKEINLSLDVIKKLQKLADQDNMSLKSFMERLLISRTQTKGGDLSEIHQEVLRLKKELSSLIKKLKHED